MSYAFDVVDELINDITESLNKLKEINTTQEKILCSIIKAYSPENECQNIFDEYTEKEYFLKITNVFLEGNLYTKTSRFLSLISRRIYETGTMLTMLNLRKIEIFYRKSIAKN